MAPIRMSPNHHPLHRIDSVDDSESVNNGPDPRKSVLEEINSAYSGGDTVRLHQSKSTDASVSNGSNMSKNDGFTMQSGREVESMPMSPSVEEFLSKQVGRKATTTSPKSAAAKQGLYALFVNDVVLCSAM